MIKTSSQKYNAKKKRLRNKADKLLQIKAVKLGYCESCGTKERLVGHHFCPKSLSNNLRYDLHNIIVLCMGCHFKHHNGDPQIYENFTKNKSAQWFNYIRKNRNVFIKPTLAWYESKIIKLK